MDGDFVTQVDVCCNANWISAVRFHTNQQVSQWFGSMTGAMTSLKGRDGDYIHALVGNRGISNGSTTVKSLGALFRPCGQEPTSPTNQGYLIHPKLEGAQNIVEACPDVRAIVIKFAGESGDRIDAISVLSASQYRGYVTLSNLIKQNADEHWVVLIPGEQLVAVHALSGQQRVKARTSGDSRQRVKKLRLVTNYRTTPWFGVNGAGETQVFDLDGKPEGSYICGFQSTSDSSGLESIGVVYWVPKELADVGIHEVE